MSYMYAKAPKGDHMLALYLPMPTQSNAVPNTVLCKKRALRFKRPRSLQNPKTPFMTPLGKAGRIALSPARS